jgi:hypothetical protein
LVFLSFSYLLWTQNSKYKIQRKRKNTTKNQDYQPTITGDLVGEENETKSPVMVGSGGKSNKINKRKKKKIIKIAFFYLIFFLFLFIFSSLPNSFSLLGF